MSICLSAVFPQDSLSFGAKKSIQQIPPPNLSLSPRFPLSTVNYSFCFHSCLPLSTSVARKSVPRSLHCAAPANNSDSAGNIESYSASKAETQINHPLKKSKGPQTELNNDAGVPPTTIPKKPRRGRRSEAVAVEDFVRDSLEKTFASIRKKNPDVFTRKEQIFKKVRDKAVSDVSAEEDDNDDDDDDDDNQTEKQMVVDDEDPNWPADADVGWGIRASDYFEQHAIKNVVGDDGLDIDWEGEIDDTWIQEINCLEWESFAFHPSPLIVLVFERYNRAADNWKLLKELEKAFLVYWNAKDRLPPRAVKLDINIERDLAYALKVKQCPQILFLRGQRVLYREKELRTADELVQMIAYFYYKARKPAWIDDEALAK